MQEKKKGEIFSNAATQTHTRRLDLQQHCCVSSNIQEAFFWGTLTKGWNHVVPTFLSSPSLRQRRCKSLKGQNWRVSCASPWWCRLGEIHFSSRGIAGRATRSAMHVISRERRANGGGWGGGEVGGGVQTHSSSPWSDRKGSKTTAEKVVLLTALAPALGPSCSQYVAGDKRTEKERHKRKHTCALRQTVALTWYMMQRLHPTLGKRATFFQRKVKVTLKNLSFRGRWTEFPPSVNHPSFFHTCTCLNV